MCLSKNVWCHLQPLSYVHCRSLVLTNKIGVCNSILKHPSTSIHRCCNYPQISRILHIFPIVSQSSFSVRLWRNSLSSGLLMLPQYVNRHLQKCSVMSFFNVNIMSLGESARTSIAAQLQSLLIAYLPIALYQLCLFQVMFYKITV